MTIYTRQTTSTTSIGVVNWGNPLNNTQLDQNFIFLNDSKRPILTRIGTVVSTATVTPSTESDQYNITALATIANIAIPTGSTAFDGQKLTIRIKDNGTAYALSWVTTAGGYRTIGTILPLITIATKTMYIGCIYNAADSFWDVVSVAQQV